MPAAPGRPQGSHKANPLTDAEMQWQEAANCRSTDPEVFFPLRGVLTVGARRICSSCEVRTACLEHALTHGERYGIWGGMSETQRRELKRDRRSVSA